MAQIRRLEYGKRKMLNATSPPTPSRQQGSKRILVLGSVAQTGQVTAYAWDQLPAQINVADFDSVILNLASFLEQQATTGIRPERLPSWQQLARLLFSSGSEVICIGLPTIDTANSLYESTTWWLPVMPDFVLESGESIRAVKPEFAYYFEHVNQWFFYAVPKFKAHFLGLANYLRVVHPQANNLQVGMQAIASTRLQQPIAFKLVFRAVYANRSQALAAQTDAGLAVRSPTQVKPLMTSGLAIWLPPPTEITVEEAVDLILRERYGVGPEQQAIPPWAEVYQLPQQQAIALKIAQHQQTIQALLREIKLAQQQLESASYFSRLLYEQNQTALESIVIDALQALGGQIQRRHDAASPLACLELLDPARRPGVLLICVRQGAVKPDDLRQLDQAVRTLIFEQEWQGKGILIANAHCRVPPEARPAAFPENCLRAAQHFGYCLLTTPQLFAAIAAHQRGELDVTDFWQRLLDGSGECSLPAATTAQTSPHGHPLASRPKQRLGDA